MTTRASFQPPTFEDFGRLADLFANGPSVGRGTIVHSGPMGNTPPPNKWEGKRVELNEQWDRLQSMPKVFEEPAPLDNRYRNSYRWGMKAEGLNAFNADERSERDNEAFFKRVPMSFEKLREGPVPESGPGSYVHERVRDAIDGIGIYVAPKRDTGHAIIFAVGPAARPQGARVTDTPPHELHKLERALIDEALNDNILRDTDGSIVLGSPAAVHAVANFMDFVDRSTENPGFCPMPVQLNHDSRVAVQQVYGALRQARPGVPSREDVDRGLDALNNFANGGRPPEPPGPSNRGSKDFGLD